MDFLSLRCSRATLCCGVWASHCDGVSCFGAQVLGAWASVAVVHRLSCLIACESSQTRDPCPLQWQVDFQPLDHQGSPVVLFSSLLILSSARSTLLLNPSTEFWLFVCLYLVIVLFSSKISTLFLFIFSITFLRLFSFIFSQACLLLIETF